MRICIYNGKIIEMQGSATPGTLIANAERAGLIGATEQDVTQAEYDALMYSQRDCALEKTIAMEKFRYEREILLARMTGVRVNDILPTDTASINALIAMRTSLKDLPSIQTVVNATDKATTQTAVINEWNAIKSTFISAVPAQESIFTGLSPI